MYFGGICRQMAKKFPLSLALVSLGSTTAVMILCLAVWHLTPQIPLLLGCLIAAVVARIRGCPWREIGSGILRSIRQAGEAIILLLLIGALIGVWIAAGVVPAMIRGGLTLLSPRLFLAGAMLVCALISMVLGSWGTAGTVGLALMGIAHTFGIPAPLAAGAVISGSYVGDKLSPLADTTNLAAAVAEVSVFDSIRNIFKVSAPMLLLCLGIYAGIGMQYGGDGGAMAQAEAVSRALSDAFRIGPLNLLPLLILLVCILVKIPPIPSLLAGLVSGAVYGAIVQNTSLPAILRCAVTGYVGRTGESTVDQLLTAGGMWSMAATISIILLAMSFGGIMEQTGQMAALTAPLMDRVRSFPGLMALTVATGLGTNILLPDQYIAITLPGKMYAAAYDSRSISRLDLALGIGVSGALTSALVPWNTCGMFMAGVLGVSTLHYLPYTFYNYGMLLAAVVYAVIKQRFKTKG